MIAGLCISAGLPPEAADALQAAYERICGDEDFRRAQELFFRNCDASATLLKSVARRFGLPVNTVCGAAVVSLIPQAREIFRSLGIPEEVTEATLRDLAAKNQESFARCGVWGTFALKWYARLLAGKILKLGRLEYEEGKWGTEGQEDYAPWLRVKDRVWKVHIPSNEPFSPDAVTASLRQAYDYFGIAGTERKLMPISCASWMLSPRLKRILGEQSNILRFAELFDVYFDRDDREDLWRVFGVQPNEKADNLPLDNSLRRGVARWLKNGETLGFARGILIFDGEKIVNKNM